jgi:ATP-binding cassette subfamily B (MDR/TAP) protein 1
MEEEEIFCLIDRCQEVVKGNDKKKIIGRVNLSDVKLRYKKRNNIKVMRGLNIEVRNGKNVEMVGEYGCGKSKIMEMMK